MLFSIFLDTHIHTHILSSQPLPSPTWKLWWSSPGLTPSQVEAASPVVSPQPSGQRSTTQYSPFLRNQWIMHLFHQTIFSVLNVQCLAYCPLNSKEKWKCWSLRRVPFFGTPWTYNPPDSSVHEILQARIPEWVAMPSSRGCSQLRDRTLVSCIAGRFCTIWATMEALVYNKCSTNAHWVSVPSVSFPALYLLSHSALVCASPPKGLKAHLIHLMTCSCDHSFGLISSIFHCDIQVHALCFATSTSWNPWKASTCFIFFTCSFKLHLTCIWSPLGKYLIRYKNIQTQATWL